MQKVLVTGVNGFVGGHVSRALHQLGHIVVGVSNQSTLSESLTDIVAQYISCDLTDTGAVSTIDLSEIDAIINLAGLAKVGDSIGKGELYNQVNIGVHTVLYEECLNQGATPRIIAISTGAVYDPAQPLPITEESALVKHDKTNEYTISKILMEEAVAKFNGRGLDCIIVRPFNHSGPGQLPGFLLPDLGEQIQQSIDKNEPLLVGNLDTKRDYTDVRDVAQAYATLATCKRERLHHTMYNICSGKSVPGKEILRLLAEAFDASEVETEQDPARIRPNEIMDIYGSRERITTDTGWEPHYTIAQMVNDYADWKKESLARLKPRTTQKDQRR